MKILYWIERPLCYIGGVETFSRQLISAMQARGHSFTVITTGHAKNGIQPEITPYGPTWHFPVTEVLTEGKLHQITVIDKEISKIIRTFQPDLIHLNTILPSVFFYLRNRAAAQVPTVLTQHMPVIAGKTEGIIGQVINRVNHLVTVSHAVLEYTSRIAPGIAGRATVIYNALPTAPLAPAPLAVSPPVLLCLGRFVHQKGFDIALDAFPRVLSRYPAAVLRFVGAGQLRANLEQHASRLGLGDSVQFVGPVDHHNIYHQLNQASIVLVPSRYEPFGLVALEAAQMARPVIASQIDGLPEVVSHQETGLLVEPEHSNQLADAVLTLLDQPMLAEQYGQQARRLVQSRFAFDKFINAYDEVYHNLCS